MQGRGIRGRSIDDNGMFHRAVLLQDTHNLRHCRTLLADRDVDTDQVFALLIDDRIQGNRGLTGLAVTNDQLALTTANRNHGINGRNTSRHRLIHRLALDHTGRNAFDVTELIGRNGPFAINRLTDSVDNTANQRITNRHRNDATGAAD